MTIIWRNERSLRSLWKNVNPSLEEVSIELSKITLNNAPYSSPREPTVQSTAPPGRAGPGRTIIKYRYFRHVVTQFGQAISCISIYVCCYRCDNELSGQLSTRVQRLGGGGGGGGWRTGPVDRGSLCTAAEHPRTCCARSWRDPDGCDRCHQMRLLRRKFTFFPTE